MYLVCIGVDSLELPRIMPTVEAAGAINCICSPRMSQLLTEYMRGLGKESLLKEGHPYYTQIRRIKKDGQTK